MTGEELLKEITVLEEKIKYLQSENKSLKRKEYDVDNQIETIEVRVCLLSNYSNRALYFPRS